VNKSSNGRRWNDATRSVCAAAYESWGFSKDVLFAVFAGRRRIIARDPGLDLPLIVQHCRVAWRRWLGLHSLLVLLPVAGGLLWPVRWVPVWFQAGCRIALIYLAAWALHRWRVREPLLPVRNAHKPAGLVVGLLALGSGPPMSMAVIVATLLVGFLLITGFRALNRGWIFRRRLAPGSPEQVWSPAKTPERVRRLEVEHHPEANIVAFPWGELYFPFPEASSLDDGTRSYRRALATGNRRAGSLHRGLGSRYARAGYTMVDLSRAQDDDELIKPFEVDELNDRIRNEVNARQKPKGLDAVDRLYVGLNRLGHDHRFTDPDTGLPMTQATYLEMVEVMRNPEPDTRHHLVIEAADPNWQGLLAFLMFVRLDKSDDLLLIETAQFELLPPKEEFNRLGRLRSSHADARGPWLIWQALQDTPEWLLLAPWRIAQALDLALRHAWGWWRDHRSARPEGRIRDQEPFVLRELISRTELNIHNEAADYQQHRQALERTILQTIISFLKEHNINPEDLEKARANVFNNYGTNFQNNQSVDISGPVAGGPNSSINVNPDEPPPDQPGQPPQGA
jgi:hypothetical protein